MQTEAADIFYALLARIQKDKPTKTEQLTAIITDTVNPLYGDMLELDEEVRVHAEMKTFPEKLIRSKAPNQHPDEFKYIKESYQPETLSAWHIAESNTNRIFNPQNYSIKWKDEENATDKTEDYFTKNYPVYKDIIAYFDSIVRSKKLKFPNAVLAVKPSYIPLTETETEGQKTYKIDQTKSMEPVAVIYETEQVLAFKGGHYAIVLVREKSEVIHYDKPVKDGLIFEIYDRNTIYRVEQFGKKTDWTFNEYVYYGHNYNNLPVWQLGGEKKAIENDYINISWLYKSVPVLNQVVYDTVMLNASKAANAYPEKYEFVQKCSAGCDSGKVPDYNSDTPNSLTSCDHCKGTGVEPRIGVLGVHQINLSNGRFDDPIQVPTPPAGYIDKNSAIMEFLRSEIDKNTAKAFRFLGIDVSDSEVKGSETALGKIIDREALFSALRTIAAELFQLLQNTVNAIGYMRWGKDFKTPDINPPTTFAIRTYQDITEEISTATTAQLPEMAIRTLILEYMQTRFSSNADKTAVYNLITAADVLQNKAEVDINAALATGRIAKWRAVLHDNIYQYIEKAIAKDSGFLNKELMKKVEALELMAKEEAGSLGGGLDADTIISDTGDNIETPVDVEAEAKARLKGTVGGVQGILEIQRSVSEGTTDRGAAIALMEEIYGFDAAKAGKMLGTPKAVSVPAPAPSIAE